jgi:predicted amidohydrolase
MGADVALFPEMWNIGYAGYDAARPGAREAWALQAIDREGEFVTHIRSLARGLGMAVVLTYLERTEGLPRNSASLIDRHGEIVMTYAKVHTCDFDQEAACEPGDDFYVAALDTAAGDVEVGIMICYDREFPESARVLMLKGAEIILTPNACTLDAARIGQFRTRAFENMVGVAMANYAAPRFNGHSVAFDATVYDEDERSRDTLVIEAGEAEGIYLAPFDLDAIRAYRRRETWGNAFRKPRAYGVLTSPEVRDPFIREDARR